MNKVKKIFHVLFSTRVLNKNKLIFAFFFLITHLMNLSLRVNRKIGNFVKRFFSMLPRIEFIIENKIGRWVVVPFNDTMTISSEYFEKELMGWPNLSENKRLFLDIGANIGRYSLLAANNLGYQKILAIEANPETAYFLNRNVELNEQQKIIVVKNIAVGESAGHAIIQADSHHLGGANVIVDKEKQVTMDHIIPVPLSTVDILLKESGMNAEVLDFVKMDVEGMEDRVLSGMRETLAGMPIGSMIMVEISAKSNANSILRSYNFTEIESIESDHLFKKIP